jgi:hypothetical protein
MSIYCRNFSCAIAKKSTQLNPLLVGDRKKEYLTQPTSDWRSQASINLLQPALSSVTFGGDVGGRGEQFSIRGFSDRTDLTVSLKYTDDKGPADFGLQSCHEAESPCTSVRG